MTMHIYVTRASSSLVTFFMLPLMLDSTTGTFPEKAGSSVSSLFRHVFHSVEYNMAIRRVYRKVAVA